MKKHLRLTFYIILSSIIGAAILNLFSSAPSLLNLLDRWFLISMVLLIIGASLFVVQGGFFNGLIFSFKRFTNRMTKQGQYASEFDHGSEMVEDMHFSITMPFLLAGIIQLFITFVWSFML